MRRINFSIVFILLAGVFWGMLGMFTRFLSDSGITDPEKLFVRCGVSFVVIFLYLLCRNRSLLKISLRDIWMFLGSGIMSVGSFCLVYFYTVAHIDVSIAAVMPLSDKKRVNIPSMPQKTPASKMKTIEKLMRRMNIPPY